MNLPSDRRGARAMPATKLPADLTVEMVMDAYQADDNLGFCMECGLEAYGVEPDAREYNCEGCEAPAVYGAGELLVMFA